MSKNLVRKAIGFMCLLIGLALMVNGFRDVIKSNVLRGSVEDEMGELLQEALLQEEFNTTQPTLDIDDTQWIYPTDYHEPILNRVDNVQEYASVGAFIIPKIDQTIAIMDGVGGNNMYRGASEQYQDQKMGVGNYVLSSHRMYDGTLFGRLEEVEVGDEVYITDYDTVYKYVVMESDNNVETTQTHLLKDTSEPILTFYGCTSDGKMRVVKQAKLIGYSLITDLSEEDKNVILENIE